MEKILEYVLELINHNLFTAMVGGGIAEQVVVPIPSPVISMAGGASLFGLHTSFFPSLLAIITKVAIPYAIGATLGTSIIFFIIYYGGHPILDKFGKYIGISKKLVDKIQKDFKKTMSDELFVILGGSIPIVPVSIITGMAGLFRYNPLRFFALIFIALCVRATILGFIGYKMGQTFLDLAKGLGNIESTLTIIFAIFILGFFYIKRKQYIDKNE